MSISLSKSVASCKVNTAWSNRIQSDRFLNPQQAVCIPFSGKDLTGRSVAPDSFYTKSAGCNSAQDRVVVENMLRPQYSDYITLNMGAGLAGDIYSNPEAQMGERETEATMAENYQRTGNFGKDFRSFTQPTTCKVNSYEKAMAQQSFGNRQAETFQNYNRALNNGSCSGAF